LFESDVGTPLRRALWLDAVDLKLRGCLPEALAAHARLANVDRGRLVYLVDAPVWHARLRLLADRLCDEARALGLDVTTIVVKTARDPLPGAASTSGGPARSQSRTTTSSGTTNTPTPALRLSAVGQEVLRQAAALMDTPAQNTKSDRDGSGD
jgi:Dna[CI] antecedent, DciA